MNNAFANYKLPEAQKKEPKYYWQRIAMDAISYLEEPKSSTIFKWAKTKESKLKAALEYMKAHDKKHFLYLCKLMAL